MRGLATVGKWLGGALLVLVAFGSMADAGPVGVLVAACAVALGLGIYAVAKALDRIEERIERINRRLDARSGDPS